jgi:anthranilate synthase component 1
MSGPRLSTGEILPLVRRFVGAPDPLALHAAVTEGGLRPNTLLLESADAATGVGERSVIVARSMLRLACRGRAVEVEPLSPNGVALAGRIPRSFSNVDAVERDERARLLAPGPLDALRAAALEPRLVSEPGPFCHFAAGVFSYDLLDLFERLPAARVDGSGFPDYAFWIPDRTVIVDHIRNATTVVALVVGGDSAENSYHDAVRDIERLARVVEEIGAQETDGVADSTAPSRIDGVEVDLDDEAFADLVRRVRRHVVAGDVFQIVPSRTFSMPCDDPLTAYKRLRAANPSPYQFFIRAPGFTLLGASPETAVRVEGEPKQVSIRPIAGTAPRGRSADGSLDAELDARHQAALLTDRKELAEHLMLVDLARNDVARVSRPGTRSVSRLLTVERYRHVMHLVSEVTGELAGGLDALHAYAASLNMGTLVGAPKIRAAQLLREYECTKRGPYGGAVGYLSHDGALDTAIVIRSAFVRDAIAQVRAGAGVVLDSDPDREAAETRHKAEAVLRALALEVPA